MVHFKRGEAYEAIGDRKCAADDYRRALALFPMAEWKKRAEEALKRVAD